MKKIVKPEFGLIILAPILSIDQDEYGQTSYTIAVNEDVLELIKKESPMFNTWPYAKMLNILNHEKFGDAQSKKDHLHFIKDLFDILQDENGSARNLIIGVNQLLENRLIDFINNLNFNINVVGCPKEDQYVHVVLRVLGRVEAPEQAHDDPVGNELPPPGGSG